MKLSKELIEFLNLNPIDQVRYSFHCLNAWTSAPRYLVVIKLCYFLSFIKLEKASFYLLVYSGLLRRLIEKELLTVEALDQELVEQGYSHDWLGYGERLSSPWRHTFTRLAMFFRAN